MNALLIAGTSHVGKSTLAARIAADRGCPALSTDKLARHPGRPWPDPPAPVAEFYETLTPETIYWFLRVHHENLRPGIERLIRDSLPQGFFVLEGAALRPEYLAPLALDGVEIVCLHAAPESLRARIHAESRYAERATRQRAWIDAFLTRSLQDNTALADAARLRGLPVIDAANLDAVEALYARAKH